MHFPRTYPLFLDLLSCGMACLLLGCSHPKQPQRTIQNAPITRLNTPNDSAIVAQRVTEIYGFLCKSMNDSNVEAPDGAAFERRFCSRAWNEESKKVAQIDARHPGEIGLGTMVTGYKRKITSTFPSAMCVSCLSKIIKRHA